MLKPFALAGLSTLVFAVGGPAMAREKAAAEPVIKVVLKNDKVTVTDARFPPGAVSKTQDRPGRVVHYFTPAHFRLTFPDGKTQDVVRKAGETVWTDGATYQAENAGKNEIHLLSVAPK